jgi:hypothetical protein
MREQEAALAKRVQESYLKLSSTAKALNEVSDQLNESVKNLDVSLALSENPTKRPFHAAFCVL